jgi:hypothetical protein
MKNKAALLNDENQAKREGYSSALEKTADDAERNERLAKQLTKGQFMPLTDNPPPPLAQQKQHPLLQTNWSTFADKNRGLLTDDSIPPQIYNLVQQYREKARTQRPGNDLALLIDDFFAESHQILKDLQLREVARVRNEGNVEIQKLKHALKGRPHYDYDLTAKENLAVKTVKQGGQIPLSNELERQRRNLI